MNKKRTLIVALPFMALGNIPEVNLDDVEIMSVSEIEFGSRDSIVIDPVTGRADTLSIDEGITSVKPIDEAVGPARAPRRSPITTTNGVAYSRNLQADLVEITEDTGESITIGGEETTQLEGHYEYAATGYTCYLPYALTLSNENAMVYKPTTSEVVDGVTTITFEQVFVSGDGGDAF